MIELHGWLTVYPTCPDEDRHPEIDEESIYRNVEMLVESSNLQGIVKLGWRNGSCHLDTAYFSNHENEETSAILNLFRSIAETAEGSYGLVYYRNDENYGSNDYQNQFRVLVIKKGTCRWADDSFLSPCIPTIEEG